MMIEGDPSINAEDQKKMVKHFTLARHFTHIWLCLLTSQGWDKAGKISCQEFSRIATAMRDFSKRFEMNEI